MVLRTIAVANDRLPVETLQKFGVVVHRLVYNNLRKLPISRFAYEEKH
jgi:hypothetical protein